MTSPGPSGSVLPQPGEELGGGQRLHLAGLVELAPGACDEGRGVLERRLALVAEGEGTGHVPERPINCAR